MSNRAFTNALARIPQGTPPVWFMRQAGRYHQHYQNLKQKHTFVELCKVPELAAEVAMGPIRDFDFDVAILFSDLLFPLEALGMGLKYDPGPILSYKLSPQNIQQLKSPREAIVDLEFQRHAVQLTRQILPKEKSLIGFVGGPWTLFTYASEGGHHGDLIVAKTQLQLFDHFCEILLPLLEMNIELQLSGGAEVVMIFDTAAGEVSPALFQSSIAPKLKYLAQKFPGKLGYYSKMTQLSHVQDTVLRDTNWAGYGFDHRWNLPQLLPTRTHGFTQGNFDQALLFCDTDTFKKHLDLYLNSFKNLPPDQRKGWVCGLGHGVLQKTPEAHVKYFVERVREVLR